MSKYTIEITEPAENDLCEIISYIANELLEPTVAKKTLEKISTGILKLEGLPLRNELVKDNRLSLQGIRKIIIDNYIVFYIVTEEDKNVTIIRILHSKRNWIELI